MKNCAGRLCLFFLLSILVIGYGIAAMAAKPSRPLEVPKSYNTIQEAINAASDGDTILVNNGVYPENINFFGKAITLRSVNGAAETIIDGGNNGRVVTFTTGEGPSSVLDGFTLQNGCAIDGAYYGAGIYCGYSSPTITNCIISGNSTPAHGGGGIACDFASPTISNCIISGNYALLGGGIHCWVSSPKITDCVIRGNSSMDAGGGMICASYSSPTISNCTISGNTQRSSYGTGGGIASGSNSSPAIINCTISGNYSAGHGGGISIDSNSLATVANSIFWGNVAIGEGNEIYTGSASITVTYSDVQGGDPLNPGQPWPGTGNIDADPLFVDPYPPSGYPISAGDYHLGSNQSPCINAGDPTSASQGFPEYDIDGDPRTAEAGGDGLYDMGSDESREQACSIIITKAIYDYVNDQLEVEATSSYGSEAILELVGYGEMTWINAEAVWQKTVTGITPAPSSVVVYGPLDGCQIEQ